MLKQTNPDVKKDRQDATSELLVAVRDSLQDLKGWQNVRLAKLGIDTINARHDTNAVVDAAVVNKIVQGVAKLGWKVASTEDDETIFECEGVRIRLLLQTHPERTITFLLKYI